MDSNICDQYDQEFIVLLSGKLKNILIIIIIYYIKI